ncbi:MAG: hypothetical protein K1X88_11045 [Nannocystaceae bacterium]|nr:hypothetical protein [Nannocystaceae bacterium]
MRNLFLIVSVVGLAFAACEKSNQPTNPPAGDTAGDTAGTPTDTGGGTPTDTGGGATDTGGGTATEPGAPGVAWADKTHKQRMEFMGLEVLPKMKKTFQAYDGTGFATFKCETCHGKSGKDKDYKMPNDLYPLGAADPIKEASEYDAKVTKFMVDEVVPQMAAMMGDKLDKPGAYCVKCHPTP